MSRIWLKKARASRGSAVGRAARNMEYYLRSTTTLMLCHEVLCNFNPLNSTNRTDKYAASPSTAEPSVNVHSRLGGSAAVVPQLCQCFAPACCLRCLPKELQGNSPGQLALALFFVRISRQLAQEKEFDLRRGTAGGMSGTNWAVLICGGTNGEFYGNRWHADTHLLAPLLRSATAALARADLQTVWTQGTPSGGLGPTWGSRCRSFKHSAQCTTRWRCS